LGITGYSGNSGRGFSFRTLGKEVYEGTMKREPCEGNGVLGDVSWGHVFKYAEERLPGGGS